MAVDTEYISRKDFNSKFKNYLRDFYVYQFKNKHIDFFNTGNFSRSRMIAAIIASAADKSVQIEDFFRIKMSDIDISEDSVLLAIADKSSKKSKRTVVIQKPLSEMFKYLHTADDAAFFITGNTAKISKASEEKIEREAENFKRNCPPPVTDEKMYRYWGQVYLEEANETITIGTYRNDSIRIKALIEKMAKVEWSFGHKVDHINESLSEEDDSCVECVTSDTRELIKNPFHSLYRHCNRYSNSGKDFFNVFFALILYFNQGKVIKNNSYIVPSASRMENFNCTLKKMAAGLFLGDKEEWSELTQKQKDRYASKVPALFMNECFNSIINLVCTEYKEKRRHFYEEKSKKILESYEKKNKRAYENKCKEEGRDLIWEDIISWEDIKEDPLTLAKVKQDNQNVTSGRFLDVFIYLIANKKGLVYRDNDFHICDLEHVEKKTLYLALIEFLECGEKQFSNIIREFVNTGVLKESRELILYCDRYSSHEENMEFIKGTISDYCDLDIELLDESLNSSFSIRYDSGIEEETIDEIKRKLKSVCKKCKDSDKLFYSLSKINMHNILADKGNLTSRFSEMVSFYSQTALLGEVGEYVSDRLPRTKWEVTYKHNYIVRALNDYNNIDLLYAMQNPSSDNHYWVEIECRDALNEFGYQHFVCYPIKIVENVSDGKQYLIYYHPVYRSIASIRIDFIDSITIGERSEESYFAEDIKRAYKVIKYTWGLHFGDFYEGNVKTEPHPSKVTFKIRFETDKEQGGKKVGEKFIKDRVKREIGVFEEKELDEKYSLLTMTVEYVNPWDMLHWIKTYTRRIYDIKIEYASFMDDVERAKGMYNLPKPEHVSAALRNGGNGVLYSNDARFRFTPVESKCDRLFHEIYSDTCRTVGERIYKVITGEQTDGLFDIFSLTRVNVISNIYDLIPLTDVETQWLQNILKHKLARAFLTPKEIDYIESRLTKANWFDIYDSSTVALLDQHSDDMLEQFYSATIAREYDDAQNNYDDPDLGIIIRKMMQAICENKVVRILYKSQYDNVSQWEFVPYCLEYSKRDNRFRVKSVIRNRKTKKWIKVRTFNIDGISKFTLTNETVSECIIDSKVNLYNSKDGEKKELDIFFSDVCADQILTEFSCYKKTCVRWGNGRYRMTLTYYKEDYAEIVIRLLGYGSLISVWGEDDDEVVAQLKTRYQDQVKLYEELTRLPNKLLDKMEERAD